jgi:hypothetical protein
MKKLYLRALLVVVSAAVGAPGYLAAAGCDPGSGCCGAGQAFVGQQFFVNPAGPFQVRVGPAANPAPAINSAMLTNATRKPQTAQAKTGRIVPLARQAAGLPLEGLTVSCIPCLGTLW